MAAKGMLHCGGDKLALAETIGRSWRLPSSALSSPSSQPPKIPLEIFGKKVRFSVDKSKEAAESDFRGRFHYWIERRVMSAEETAIKRVEKNLEKVEKKVDSIETAIRGTGNPHGGLFGKIEGMEGKFTTLDVKIDGVEKALIEKIDGVREIFVKMSRLFKWFVGIVTVPFSAR